MGTLAATTAAQAQRPPTACVHAVYAETLLWGRHADQAAVYVECIAEVVMAGSHAGNACMLLTHGIHNGAHSAARYE
jgi:hypothetical protein